MYICVHMYFGCCSLCNYLNICYVVLNAIKVSAWILIFSLLQKLMKKNVQGISKQIFIITVQHTMNIKHTVNTNLLNLK